MRIIALGVVALCSVDTATAQVTFNRVQHNLNMLSSQGRSIFEQEDGYLFFSLEWGSDSSSTALFTSKLDLEGNLLEQHEFSTGRNVDPGVIDPICQSDDQYVAAVTSFSVDSPNATFLYWFNTNGDTIRTRFLKSDSGLALGNHNTRQLVALSDGGFLHCGWCSDPINTGCITRLDSTGAILWERLYTNTKSIQKATPLADGGFILGGSRNGQVDIAVVIRTDSLGAVQWSRYQGLHSNTAGTQALVEASGNILVPGSWKDDPSPFTYDRWACLYEYTSSGTLVGRKDYVYSYNATAVHILPKPEGHYWLVGGMYQYGVNPDGVLTLWELDENLDSLWMRRYWYYEPDGAENAAYSVRSTTDGGLIMCGMTRQGVTDPLPYMQSNWLLKLDAYGCLVPGCHTVGVQEHTLGLNSFLTLAPNPVQAGTPLYITFEPPEGYTAKGTMRVVVLDALGKEVHTERFKDLTTPTPFGLQIPAGLYYIHLMDGERWLAGGKVVVQ